MAELATEITTIGTSVLGLAGVAIAAGMGLFAVKHGATFVKGLFRRTS